MHDRFRSCKELIGESTEVWVRIGPQHLLGFIAHPRELAILTPLFKFSIHFDPEMLNVDWLESTCTSMLGSKCADSGLEIIFD